MTVTKFLPVLPRNHGQSSRTLRPEVFCVNDTDTVMPPEETERHSRTAPRARSNATPPATSSAIWESVQSTDA